MHFDDSSGAESGVRWDQLFEVLSAEPRRQLLIAMATAPDKGYQQLPDAAASRHQSKDADRLALELRHLHLPKLVEAGFVRWDEDRSRVRPGPRFQEVEYLLGKILDSVEEMPASLVGCPTLQEFAADG